MHNQMNGEQEQHKNNEDIKFMYEHELFPEMKRSLVIRSKFAAEGDMTFSMITCTENLYKVFERC